MVQPPFINPSGGRYGPITPDDSSLPLAQRMRIRYTALRKRLDTMPFLGNTRFRILFIFFTFILLSFTILGVFRSPSPTPTPETFEDPPVDESKVQKEVMHLSPVPMIEISKLVEITKSQPPTGKGTFEGGHYFNSTKAAVIIETRPLENLVPLILHFSSVLGPEWPVILYTSMDHMIDSAALRYAMGGGRVVIRYLPEGLKFETHFDVSKFLTETWFWDQLAPADNVLLFQADSIICANSQKRVDDFLEWDLIGAPIPPEWHGVGYNGGLSLRNRKKVLQILNDRSIMFLHPLNATAAEDPDKYEDQWFFSRMKEKGFRLPEPKVARTFSVQMKEMFYETPLGYHQPELFLTEEQMGVVGEWCPEYKLCTEKFLKCEPPVC